MRHFLQIADGLPVEPLAAQIDAQPELWSTHDERRTHEGTSHAETSDIWVRYNDIRRAAGETHRERLLSLTHEHVPVWYPAWQALPALRPFVFSLMAAVEGEMLGGVLITRVPPGGVIAPHADTGWHVNYYDKFYVAVQSAPGADFVCEHDGEVERLNMRTGDVWLFDNRKVHSVENNSDQDRITLIVCIRTQMFGRF